MEKPRRELVRGPSRTSRPAQAKLDRQLEKANRRISALHDQMAAAGSDFARLAELDSQLTELLATRDGLELEWLHAAELSEF